MGFPHATAMLAGGSGADYAASLAAVTNKTLILDASAGAGTAGQALSTTNLNNTGSAGGSFRGAAKWRGVGNGQNGLNTVLVDSSGTSMQDGSNNPQVSSLISSVAFTAFLVCKINRPTDTTTRWMDNGNVIQGWSPFSNQSGGRSINSDFRQDEGTTITQAWSGQTYSNDVAMVLAIRCNSGGTFRWNKNGTTGTLSGTKTDGYANNTNRLQFYPYNSDSDSFEFCESVISSSDQTDQVMDALVLAMKAKWGIA